MTRKIKVKKRNEPMAIWLTTEQDQAGLANPRIHIHALRSSLPRNTSTCVTYNNAACINIWTI